MKRYFSRLVGFLAIILGPVIVQAAERPLFSPGEAGAPTGQMEQDQLEFVITMARRVSLERGWMTQETLRQLEEGSLRLDKSIEGAPAAILADGRAYIPYLEMVGPLWAGFDPASDPYVVFLNQEVYAGLGDDRALAFQDGIETVIVAGDLDLLPALGLSMEIIELAPFLRAPGEQVGVDPSAAALPSPDMGQLAKLSEVLGSGHVRLGFGEEGSDLVGFEDLVSATAGLLCPHTGTCPQYPPIDCASGQPVCPSGSQPFFVLNALLIKVDHEGALKGNPEIELHPLNIDAPPIAFGFPPLSPYVFDGRSVCDAVGQERFLPDINKKNVWTTFSPTALYRANIGDDWALTLVENDDAPRGRIDDRGSKVSTIQVFRSLSSISNLFRRMDSLNFLVNPSSLVRAKFPGGDDDLFQPAIGVTNDLFCNSGLNQGFPKTFALTTSEWNLQGYFACISPTCTTLQRQLRVTRNGSGSGGVTSSPSGINCGSDCSETYELNTEVTLTATPSSGSVFMGWSGDCTGTSATCSVTMDVDKTVTATFVDLKVVTVKTLGAGRVVSSPAGIDCGTTCTGEFKEGVTLELVAQPETGWVFVGWSGACTGSSLKTSVVVAADLSCEARFSRPPFAADDAAFTEQGVPVVIAVLDNDHDPDNDAIEVATFDAATANGGSVSLDVGGGLRYQPAASFVGDDSLTYDVKDVHGTVSNRATVRVHVNGAPVATDDAGTLDEDTLLEIDVLANDFDPDGDALKVLGVASPTHGTAVLLANQQVRFTPAPNFNGADAFTYTLTDAHGTTTATATVSLIVLPVNDAPTPVCQNVTRPADGACQATVAATEVDAGSSDIDGDPLSFTLAPPGPFGLGQTGVTLTADDGQGEVNSTASCSATITVVDVTQPAISCPADIVKVSIDPETLVIFDLPVSADNCTAAPLVACTPSPGDLFPVGTTTVGCSALDESGNSSVCSFTVEIRTPAEQVAIIESIIQDLIDAGILKGKKGTGLLGTFTNIDSLDCKKLGGFVNQVEAMVTSGTLTPEEGALLLEAAALLQDGLGC